jgi:hypothetical protein
MPLINETASGSMRQDSLTGQDDAEAAPGSVKSFKPVMILAGRRRMSIDGTPA